MDTHRSSRIRAAMLVAFASSVEAGQPLVTDDAAVVAPKTCQIEAGYRWFRDGYEWSAQPGCNVGRDVELSAGGGGAASDAGEFTGLAQLQAKTVAFRSADGTGALGASIGALRATAEPHGRSAFQIYYVKGLASWYVSDTLEVDVNLGAVNARGTGTYALAGLAVQTTVATGLQVLAEAFRDEPGTAKYQVGLRYAAVTDRLDVYASYGNRFGHASGHGSTLVGIRLQSPAFLP